MTRFSLPLRLRGLAEAIKIITAETYSENAAELFDGVIDPDDLRRAAKIVEVSERFARLSGEARSYRTQRNSFSCERAEGIDPEGMEAIGGFTPAEIESARASRGTVACWKRYDGPGNEPDDANELAPMSQWCEPCRQRQAAHDMYRVCVKLRGAAMRSLQKLAGAK